MSRVLQALPQVAVLDACVLVPPALRDLLLSAANVGLFRPVWQDEILDEVRRNSIRLLIDRKQLAQRAAETAVQHTLVQMARAFPDACCDSSLWVPLVSSVSCDSKDRHVLAVAVGSEATHLLTDNTRDFPMTNLPNGLTIGKPDQFMLDQLAASPDLVIEAVVGMSRRLRNPRQTPNELAKMMAGGRYLSRFGAEVLTLLS